MRTYYFIHDSVPIAFYYGGQAGAQLGTEVGALTSLEADGKWFFCVALTALFGSTSMQHEMSHGTSACGLRIFEI